MVSKNKPDWPPPGWKVNTKVNNGRKIKYYTHSKTHQKFYSKPAVLQYIRDGCISNEKFRPEVDHAKKSSGETQLQLVEANEFEWLPTGWVTEKRIRKSGVRIGTEYKCYIDPSTGSKFFSKPEVLRYLNSKQSVAGLSTQLNRRGNQNSSSKRLVDSLAAEKSDLEPKVSPISKSRVRKSLSSGKLKVITERTMDEELPSGWIKETRIKMLRNKVVRRDSFFNDPVSSLVFRSKLEVLRYVKTGEISRHAFRRKNGSITEKDYAIGKTPASSCKQEETPKRMTRSQVFAGEASGGQSILALPETGSDFRSEETSSSKREETTKRMTRSQVFACEASGGQSIRALPEAGSNKKVEGKKSKRSSARVRPAPAVTSSPKQSTLSPEPVRSSHDILVTKPSRKKLSGTKEAIGMTKQTSSEVRDAGEENPVALAIQDYSDGKAQTSKRKTKDMNLPCVPSRSSKRLAGVGAKVVYLPKPIEHVLRATTRTSTRTSPICSLESVTIELQEKNKDNDTQDCNDHALQATSKNPSRSVPIPNLKSVSRTKDRKLPSVPSRSSKRFTGVDDEVVFNPIPIENALQDTNEMSSRTNPISGLESVSNQEKSKDVSKQDVLASQEEKQTLDVNVESLLTTQRQPSNKIDNLPSQEEKHRTLGYIPEILLATIGESSNKNEGFTSHHCSLDPGPESVLAAHREASNKINVDLITEGIFLVLNDLQLEQAPPGFSENTKVEESSIKTKQSLEHPIDTLLESTSKVRPIVEEKLTSIEMETEKPQSEICLSFPLWSDPCLEFAYKTLTGAIPFDDNLAIQDYIQHQIRTSEDRNKNQRLPSALSVFKSDEAAIVRQFPEDTNFPNSKCFGSPEFKQVKNK